MSDTEELFRLWRDPQATLGGVVAIDSRCSCGNGAIAMLDSPRWGAWDACQPCGTEQLAVLHGADPASLTRGLVRAAALRSIELDRMLSS